MNKVTPELNAGRVLDASAPEVAARYKLNDIFCSSWLSYAITAAVKNGIPDAVRDRPTTASQVAAECGLDPGIVYRVLRGLSKNGVFEQVGTDSFVHTEVSHLLRKDHPFSWRGMALMWNHPSCLEGWKHFYECMQDGRSGIEHAFGQSLYEHLGEDPTATMAFSDAMISNSAHVSLEIAKEFPFEKYKSVLDLGGGIGTLIAAIAEKHPHLRAAVYEIKDLEEAARRYLQNRASVVVGSFLESVPSDFDLYFVKNSLWNWDDDNTLTIMKNVRAAIGDNTYKRFVIVEYIIDESNERWTTVYDLQILNMPGGRARTTAEYADLLAQAGFRIDREMRIEDQTLLIAKPV